MFVLIVGIFSILIFYTLTEELYTSLLASLIVTGLAWALSEFRYCFNRINLIRGALFKNIDRVDNLKSIQRVHEREVDELHIKLAALKNLLNNEIDSRNKRLLKNKIKNIIPFRK